LSSHKNGGLLKQKEGRLSQISQPVCTGQEGTPFTPEIEGASDFSGDTLHSSEFNNGAKWKEKKNVLVGFDNSGSECNPWRYKLHYAHLVIIAC
jgi:indole-3-pyruvate monooxygenase